MFVFGFGVLFQSMLFFSLFFSDLGCLGFCVEVGQTISSPEYVKSVAFLKQDGRLVCRRQPPESASRCDPTTCWCSSLRTAASKQRGRTRPGLRLSDREGPAPSVQGKNCVCVFSSLHSLTACLCRIGSQELDLGRFTVYSPAIMLGLMTYVCGPPVEKMSFDINHCPRTVSYTHLTLPTILLV